MLEMGLLKYKKWMQQDCLSFYIWYDRLRNIFIDESYHNDYARKIPTSNFSELESKLLAKSVNLVFLKFLPK